MKLDELQHGHRLSLDVTPLIDIVFLLVLFFAVTTSFISPEKIEELKTEIVRLTHEKGALVNDLERSRIELKAGNDRIVLLDERLLELQSALQALAATKRQQTETLARLNDHVTRVTDEYDDLAKQTVTRIAVLADANAGLEERVASQQTLIQGKDAMIEETRERLRELEGRSTSLARRFETLESQYRELSADATALDEANGSLGEEVERLRAALAVAQAGNEKYRAIDEKLSARQHLIDQTSRSLNADLSGFLAEGTLEIKKRQDRLTVHLSDAILFDSGSDEIKPEGLKVLARVGKVLKDRISDLEIQIGGHTDNVPIRGKSGGLYDSNWGLSAARAVNVVRYLEDEVGIPADHMTAAGHSQYRPIADNATPQGRAMNRRIEIVLLPR